MIPSIGREGKPPEIVACAHKSHHQNVQNGLATRSEIGRLEIFGGPLVPAYLVRLIKSHDIVGFFTADDLDELAIAIDECADVDACEYVELPVGGIMWESPAIPVPIAGGDEAELPELPWAKAALSGGWWSVIYGYADMTWIRFDPGAPQGPIPDPPRRAMNPARVVPLRPRKGTNRG